MGRQRKAREWWAAIPPAKRREIKERQQRAAGTRRGPVHHYQDDLACPECGTDSTVGCIASHGASR